MTNDLVSILIPVYNREQMVADCIESALNQTYPQLEVVVVDNCSTDATWSICKKYAEIDTRVRVFRNDSNLGPVRNWRRCADEARGAYAKLLFSDDLMAPDCVQECLPLLFSPDVGFVFSPAIVGPEPWQGSTRYIFRDETGTFLSLDYLKEALFGEATPVSPAAAFIRTEDLRASLIVDISSPSIIDFAAHGAGPDLLVYLLTASKYKYVAFSEKPQIFFRAHPTSITIESNKNYLLNAYRQARIWFAEEYLDQRSRQHVYAVEWRRYCKREREWSWPSSVLKKFSTRNPRFSFLTLVLARMLKYENHCKTINLKLQN